MSFVSSAASTVFSFDVVSGVAICVVVIDREFIECHGDFLGMSSP
jgi:hypothetical protein